MGDWVTLGVGALTAAAALGGSLGGHFLQERAERLRHQRVMRDRDVGARRVAYMGLFTEILRLLATADGAPSGERSEAEGHAAYLERLAEVRLRASPDTWSAMWPLTVLAEAKYTMATEQVNDQKVTAASAALEELGGGQPVQVERLQKQYLEAARKELDQGLEAVR